MSSIPTVNDELLTFPKPRDDVYGPYDSSHLKTSIPTTHTQSPAVTGTSVLGVKFKDGVVIAADNLGPHSRSSILKSTLLTFRCSFIWISRTIHRCQTPADIPPEHRHRVRRRCLRHAIPRPVTTITGHSRELSFLQRTHPQRKEPSHIPLQSHVQEKK